MQSDPPLHPIVIPPMVVTISGREFTISELNLEYDGYAFDANIASALPLLEQMQAKSSSGSSSGVCQVNGRSFAPISMAIPNIRMRNIVSISSLLKTAKATPRCTQISTL